MGAAYRVRQGITNLLRAGPRVEDRSLLESHLTRQELRLFLNMSRADQRHSLGVLRALLAGGVEDRNLLKAGLLHDVGKSRCRISLFHRTVAVLLETLLGGLPAWLSRPRDGGPWAPFYVLAEHPGIGAGMLAEIGTEKRARRLVEWHQQGLREPVPEPEWTCHSLALLRQADSQN